MSKLHSIMDTRQVYEYLVEIEGEFHNRKTTQECSEDNLNSSAERGEDGKWALCMHTTSVHTPHTHLEEYEAEWQNKQTLTTPTPQGHFVPQLYHKTVWGMSSLKISSWSKY